jgi:hypothetical protein
MCWEYVAVYGRVRVPVAAVVAVTVAVRDDIAPTLTLLVGSACRLVVSSTASVLAVSGNLSWMR